MEKKEADKPGEIEITPEMIAASCGVIRGRISEVELEILVEQAFRAMISELPVKDRTG